tara:strand:+ start:9771 stop:10979 length:1209 start_codon:yes stop_codon:yes gene_type:complete
MTKISSKTFKSNKIDLVILAGGKGSRIKQYLKDSPKPMLKFNKIHFIQYLLNKFSKYPFRNIYILTGYKGNKIFKKYHGKYINFIKINCIKEKKLMGTGGALYSLKNKISDFLLINGDTFFDIDINHLIKNTKKNICTIALIKNNYQKSKKLNLLNLNKNIVNYDAKGKLMNGGIYYFNKEIFKYIPNKKISLENQILPKLIKKKKICGITFKDFFIDIGSKKFFKIAQKKLKYYLNKKAAFLDRDGVINYDFGYVCDKKKFKIRKGVIKGLQFLIKKKYHIFLVTNQAGIAKKKFSEERFINFHRYLKYIFHLKQIYFDDVQYCPYHPKGKVKKFKKFSNYRKPGNLMVKKIEKNWIINKKKSFMIGDKISDKLCSIKSNLYFEFAKENFFNQVKFINKRF